jgi:DNA mismatch repair ATPase MutS
VISCSHGSKYEDISEMLAVQKLLSSHLLSKMLKISVYRTIVFTDVLYNCKTLSLTLKEMSGPKTENREQFMILDNNKLQNLRGHQILLR